MTREDKARALSLFLSLIIITILSFSGNGFLVRFIIGLFMGGGVGTCTTLLASKIFKVGLFDDGR